MQFLQTLALLASTGSLALGAVIVPRQGGLPVEIVPDYISSLNVNTGAVKYNDNVVNIRRTPTIEESHLATFTIPAAAQGKTCHIFFRNPSGAAHIISGSKSADIFTVIGNPTKSTTGFPREFYRDLVVGRFSTEFEKLNSYINNAPSEFPCPPAGTKKTYEAVPAGEAVHINISDSAALPAGIFLRYW